MPKKTTKKAHKIPEKQFVTPVEAQTPAEPTYEPQKEGEAPKTAEFESKLPIRESTVVNRVYYDESNINRGLRQARIDKAKIKSIEITRFMENDHGFLVTKIKVNT